MARTTNAATGNARARLQACNSEAASPIVIGAKAAVTIARALAWLNRRRLSDPPDRLIRTLT